MFSTFKLCFSVLFSSLSSWLGAFEKFGKAIDNIAGIAEEASGALADTQRIERAANVKALYAKHGLTVPETKLITE